MPTAILTLPAGTYDIMIDGSPSQVTIPQLTAGTITQSNPSVGDLLTVTPGNETATATYQWQQSVNGSTNWTDLSGATGASLDTTSSVTGDYFVRRQVSDGMQGPMATAPIQVDAPAAPASLAITRVFQDQAVGRYNTSSSGPPNFTGVNLSAIPAGEEVMLIVAWGSNSGVSTIGVPTLGGTPMNLIADNGITDNGRKMAAYRLPRPAGSGILDISIPHGDTGRIWDPAIFIDHVVGRTADVDNDFATNSSTTINTAANGIIVAVAGDQGEAADPVFTGVTAYGTVENSGADNHRFVTGQAVTTAGTQAVSAANSGALLVFSVE